MQNDDVQIVQLCQKGELEQFSKLYDKYIKKIYNFVYYRIQHKETAEDLTSLAFTKALENINTFKADKGTFNAWLYKIARNIIIDHYRARKEEYDIDDVWGLYGKEDVQLDIDIKQSLQKVEKYLSHLKSDQRDVIVMRLWDQLSYMEIAEITGKSEASCKMVYSRAIGKLRADLIIAIILMLINIKIYE